jgi:hypothetical protein
VDILSANELECLIKTGALFRAKQYLEDRKAWHEELTQTIDRHYEYLHILYNITDKNLILEQIRKEQLIRIKQLKAYGAI